MTDVSLLICTRDRGASLSRTLDSITHAVAAAPGVVVELVIVDNGSRDDTSDRLVAWQRRQDFCVVLLHEAQPGLAQARNTALARARGRIVAMTDDDCVLRPDYFATLLTAFADAATPAIIGGRILPGDPADLPVTIKLEDHPMEAVRDGFPGGFVMGANLAFTRDVIGLTGPFDTRFGAGARFVAAEDTDLLFRALGHGVRVAYDPRFVVEHHHGRRHPNQVVALLAGYGFGDGALYAKHILSDRRILRAIRGDMSAAIEERRGGERPFPYIRRFHRVRLWHMLRGFVAYARAAVSERIRGYATGAARSVTGSPEREKAG